MEHGNLSTDFRVPELRSNHPVISEGIGNFDEFLCRILTVALFDDADLTLDLLKLDLRIVYYYRI